MGTRMWSKLRGVAIASPGEESGDVAATAAHIEKVELRMGNVSKCDDGPQVVDGMSMSMGRGEVLGLLGFNGAGKRSTSWWGERDLGTMDITSLPLSHRARLDIGYMTQLLGVFWGLSVHDNIQLVLEETGVPRAQHAHRVQELIEEFSLQAVENIMGRALSRGEWRRTGLARVLASNCAEGPSKVLFVDEPFAGLNPSGVAEIQKQLRRWCDEEELGVLMTYYNVNETPSHLQLCVHGSVMGPGGPEELYHDLYVKKFYLGDSLQRW